MATLYGYARTSRADSEDALALQAGALESRRNLFRDYAWGGVLLDEKVSGSVPLPRRPAGARLCLALEAGDAVLAPCLSVLFADKEDLVTTLSVWRGKGVRLLTLDPALDTASPAGRAVESALGVLADFLWQRNSERKREGHLTMKARGTPHKQPPYGFKWAGKEGDRYLVPDKYTRDVGEQIKKWMDQGCTTEQVYWHLLRLRVKKRNEKEWGLRAIQVAYEGETRLQAIEAERGALEATRQARREERAARRAARDEARKKLNAPPTTNQPAPDEEEQP